MMRKILITLVALSILTPTGVAFSQSAKTKLTDPVQAELFNDVSDRLICQCGCMMVLRVCNHQNCPSAVPMRAEIEKQITAGVAEDDIVASFVTEYGMVVLSSPPAEGFNLAAWVMPGFALLIGLLILFDFFGNWATKRKAALAETPASIDEETRARIERELKEMSE